MLDEILATGYITKDSVLNLISEEIDYAKHTGECTFVQRLNEMVNKIKDFNPHAVEPLVYADWEYDTESKRFICKNCGWHNKRIKGFLRCPNCGAYMTKQVIVYFKNGSFIKVIPGSQNTRGYRATNVIIDSDITNQEIIHCIIRPIIMPLMIKNPKWMTKLFGIKPYHRKRFRKTEYRVKI